MSSTGGGYSTPRDEARFEQEIKKSRFIGRITPASSEEQAEASLSDLREELDDATHHCWAFVIGDPNRSARIRVSDDGEPSGTAGRPILGVTQQNNVGDALVVVVRYFGGIKLGSGGLTRAYASTAAGAIEAATLVPYVETSTRRIALDYSDEPLVRRLVDELDLELVSTAYRDGVFLTVRFPADRVASIRAAITERTHARARLVEI